MKTQARQVARYIHPLDGTSYQYEALMRHIGNAKVVMLGDASHGTQEFYEERAAITKQLIDKCGFTVVAVEADWPDCYRINRWVRGYSNDRSAEEAMSDLRIFPQWMWRNAVVKDLVTWLHDRNQDRDFRDQVGFYGLDLYSMFRSAEAVIEKLEDLNPAAARRARARYASFNNIGSDEQAYGYSSHLDLNPEAEQEVVKVLTQLHQLAAQREERLGVCEDHYFLEEMNAKLVADAEQYYHCMFRSPEESWNARDQHMAQTVQDLLSYFDSKQNQRAKIVVWAHNSHVGDARATGMKQRNEVNLGQLLRERLGPDQVKCIGFTTYTGTVLAASEWGQPGKVQHVNPGMIDSYEEFFHAVNKPRFYLNLPLQQEGAQEGIIPHELRERAIGVVYDPKTEAYTHYVDTKLEQQLDAVIHIDETTALKTLPGLITV